MDVQVGIVTRFTQMGDVLTPINAAIAAARAAAIPVIYVAQAWEASYENL